VTAQEGLEVRDRKLTSTARRRWPTASHTSQVATRSFHGIRISDGREVLRMPGIGTRLRRPRWSAIQPTSGNFSNEVLSLNLRTRRRAWSYTHPKRQFPFYSSPAVRRRSYRAGRTRQDGFIASTWPGKAIWTFTTRARVDRSPAIAGGRVTSDRMTAFFYVLDLAKGRSCGNSTPAARSRLTRDANGAS